MGESGSETGSAIAWEIFACLRLGRSLGKCNLGKGDSSGSVMKHLQASIGSGKSATTP